jgi:hypothetical protein
MGKRTAPHRVAAAWRQRRGAAREGGLMVNDERWVAALEALERHNDAREVVRLLLGAQPPEWVREEVVLWLAGSLPPDPALSTKDWRVLEAARLYYKTVRQERRTGGLPRKFRLELIERVACDYNRKTKIRDDDPDRVTPRALQSYLDREGNIYLRIRDFLRAGLREGPSGQRKVPSD